MTMMSNLSMARHWYDFVVQMQGYSLVGIVLSRGIPIQTHASWKSCSKTARGLS